MSTTFQNKQERYMKNPFLLSKVQMMNSAYTKFGDYEQAMKIARDIIALESNLIEPYQRLEDIYYEIGAPIDRQY